MTSEDISTFLSALETLTRADDVEAPPSDNECRPLALVVDKLRNVFNKRVRDAEIW